MEKEPKNTQKKEYNPNYVLPNANNYFNVYGHIYSVIFLPTNLPSYLPTLQIHIHIKQQRYRTQIEDLNFS